MSFMTGFMMLNVLYFDQKTAVTRFEVLQ